MKINYDKYPALRFEDVIRMGGCGTVKYITGTIYQDAKKVLGSVMANDFSMSIKQTETLQGVLLWDVYVIAYKFTDFNLTCRHGRIRMADIINDNCEILVYRLGTRLVSQFSDQTYYRKYEQAKIVSALFMILLFLKNVNPEAKEINNNSVSGIKCIDGDITSETDTPIQVISRCYYTTIQRTDGFGVKGHYRKQPCGKGRKQTKMIFVKDFEKKGYNREADKIKQAKLLG